MGSSAITSSDETYSDSMDVSEKKNNTYKDF